MLSSLFAIYSTESILDLFPGQLAITTSIHQLFHHRWNVPVLAAFHRAKVATGTGLRFVVLINQLGLSRDSLTKSLGALADLQLIMKNPGYGHPLRPEYVLTGFGEGVAAACEGLTHRSADDTLIKRKWSAAILLQLEAGDCRFNELRRSIDVSPRALTQALKHLVDAGLVHRSVDDGYPPRTLYRAARAATKLIHQLQRIRVELIREH